MKHLRLFLLLLIGISVFASCRKDCDEVVVREEVLPVEKGEKVTFVGRHQECVGALLFKREDGTFLRATNYPKEALNLKPGDTVYIIFKNTKTDDSDGFQFATLPIEISQLTPPNNTFDSKGLRAE